MIKTDDFTYALKTISIDFFAGVPDSLLKDFCAYLQDTVPAHSNIITANEGGAVALGAGHYLGTGRPALIYMQNSGQGNAVNPLLSLNDSLVYGIPALLMIGWRGEPGVKDEPQHVKQGMITLSLLETMGIEYAVLSGDTTISEVKEILLKARKLLDQGKCYSLVIKKGTFEKYKLLNIKEDLSSLKREEAINFAAEKIGNSGFIVSTTGKISRELFESREKTKTAHDTDFLTVGSMGHASQIAAGVALSQKHKNTKVFCFDGDGAFIMQMGNIPITASLDLPNFYHIVFNNGAHDSVGGQPTVGGSISITGIAKESGYKAVYSADSIESLNKTWDKMIKNEGPVLLEIKVKKGAREELGRPTITPPEQMKNFMKRAEDQTNE